MPTGKKDSALKANSSSLSSLHPPYIQMISEAITTMKDRTGSSQPAIAKFIEENYTKLLPPNFKKILSIQLKRFVKSEKLVKVKNSYKVSAAENHQFQHRRKRAQFRKRRPQTNQLLRETPRQKLPSGRRQRG
ncbi:UNVERIFIED_CONTAM: Histone H1 [Sesamum radiatum]|uniref:Histone H1 n=1 Tax=Sesamum radiatum TaxID=300843 RepID=A0AAW2UT55_SESRA